MKSALERFDDFGADISKIPMLDIVRYLNAVLSKWGPPCNFCKHYNLICRKGYRPRQYAMELGPYDTWYIRKKCPDFASIDTGAEEIENEQRSIRYILDCSAQQYCR